MFDYSLRKRRQYKLKLQERRRWRIIHQRQGKSTTAAAAGNGNLRAFWCLELVGLVFIFFFPSQLLLGRSPLGETCPILQPWSLCSRYRCRRFRGYARLLRSETPRGRSCRPGAERSVRGGRRHQLDVLPLLKKLVELVPFTHVMHLAAQAGVRYAMDNPSSYVHSNKPKRLLTLTTTSTASPSPPSGFLPSTVLGEDLTWLISSSPETSSEANLFPSSKAEKNTGSGGKKRGPAQLRVSSVWSGERDCWKSRPSGTWWSCLGSRNGDAQFTHANISWAQRELGYKPTTDLFLNSRASLCYNSQFDTHKRRNIRDYYYVCILSAINIVCCYYGIFRVFFASLV